MCCQNGLRIKSDNKIQRQPESETELKTQLTPQQPDAKHDYNIKILNR